jgi:hypothetical protein
MKTNSSKETLEIDCSMMKDQQKRLVKSINSLLQHVLSTKDEEDYFQSSTELMRLLATAIKKSNFNQENHSIAYDQQVLEFCVDTLSDQVYSNEVEQYDN